MVHLYVLINIILRRCIRAPTKHNTHIPYTILIRACQITHLKTLIKQISTASLRVCVCVDLRDPRYSHSVFYLEFSSFNHILIHMLEIKYLL